VTTVNQGRTEIKQQVVLKFLLETQIQAGLSDSNKSNHNNSNKLIVKLIGTPIHRNFNARVTQHLGPYFAQNLKFTVSSLMWF
jgi:hypothetical protein